MKACENCGKCCIGSPCGMAEKHGMTSTYGGRCPALVRSSGKYFFYHLISLPFFG
jgi:hypothetical protein